MPYIGDFAEDYATLVHKFTSRQFSTGAPFTLAGTPVISVYKDGATDTEKTSAEAYITLTVDFDSITGLNHILIDLSGDAFFSVGSDYSVVVTTGTVDSVSVVGEEVFSFSIENRFDEVDVVEWQGSPAPDILSQADLGTEVADQINLLFTFTVAGFVDANYQYLNDVEMLGDGVATPFTVSGA